MINRGVCGVFWKRKKRLKVDEVLEIGSLGANVVYGDGVILTLGDDTGFDGNADGALPFLELFDTDDAVWCGWLAGSALGRGQVCLIAAEDLRGGEAAHVHSVCGGPGLKVFCFDSELVDLNLFGAVEGDVGGVVWQPADGGDVFSVVGAAACVEVDGYGKEQDEGDEGV